jgi:cyclic pyranopterin phosphate synthase
MNAMTLPDRLGRPLRNLRLSVTDRCNMRCTYCMPQAEYVWLAKDDILGFEEICRLVDVFTSLGVNKVRLTGGEPLLRRDLDSLVRMLASKPGIEDLALTTNGVLLSSQGEALKAAGLHRVTVSLDTLQPERFRLITRLNARNEVLDGIRTAQRLFGSLKIDTVVVRGVNDDEMFDLIEFGKTVNAEVRFIEYMDVGGATLWSLDQVVSRREMLERLAGHYGTVAALPESSAAPAARYTLTDGTTFGIISSTTEPFCRTCDRSRLTADGLWYLCLYAAEGLDLRRPLREGASDEELGAILTSSWRARDDRGAEARLATRDREPLIPVSSLRKDPHLEMHTRGG